VLNYEKDENIRGSLGYQIRTLCDVGAYSDCFRYWGDPKFSPEGKTVWADVEWVAGGIGQTSVAMARIIVWGEKSRDRFGLIHQQCVDNTTEALNINAFQIKMFNETTKVFDTIYDNDGNLPYAYLRQSPSSGVSPVPRETVRRYDLVYDIYVGKTSVY